MNDDRMNTHEFEQDHVLRKRHLQGRVGHGIAAVFNYHGFTVVFADIRQGAR